MGPPWDPEIGISRYQLLSEGGEAWANGLGDTHTRAHTELTSLCKPYAFLAHSTFMSVGKVVN